MDLMNAMQRCGILKDKCFSQYKSSPHSGQRSLHTALTVTVFCLHQSLMNQVMRPRQATAQHLGKASDAAAGDGWLATPALHELSARRCPARLLNS